MAMRALHTTRLGVVESAWDRAEQLEADLADARAILHRLLEAEDRIGLVYPVMDDARRWLARTSHR